MVLKLVLVDDETRQHDLMQDMIGKHPLVDEFLVFNSAKSLLFELQDLSDTSAFLLDVEMPGMNGLELAKELRKREIKIPIVFMTAYPEFALESYEVNAFDYLLKPISQSKVNGLLERLDRLVPQLEPVIFFQLDGLHRIYQKDIVLCEAQGHYTRVVLNKETLLVKESISSIKKRLGHEFIVCHRSYCVNLRHVVQLNKESLEVVNGETIPVSRRLAKEVSKAFINFYQQRDFSL